MRKRPSASAAAPKATLGTIRPRPRLFKPRRRLTEIHQNANIRALLVRWELEVDSSTLATDVIGRFSSAIF